MAITQPVDLLAENGGLIESGFFPNVSAPDVLSRLDAYLVKGRAAALALGVVDPEPAAIAWAYHKAFTAVFLRLSAAPSTVQLNDAGQRSYLITQIQNFKDMADEQLALYNAQLASVVPEASTPATYAFISSFRSPA
jgi:hypothetical protein